MKKTISIFLLVMVACNKPQNNTDRAILAIKQYVNAHLSNPSSYQNISYSKLDSGYEYPDTLDIKIEDLRQAILIEQQADSVKQAIAAQLAQIAGTATDTTSSKFKNKASVYQTKLNTLLASPKQKHYYISDKYRIENKQGTLETNTINYEMDTTFKIIDTN